MGSFHSAIKQSTALFGRHILMRCSPYLHSIVARLALTARARKPDREIMKGREQGEVYGEKEGEEKQGAEGGKTGRY
jgi:hypothetical protein